MPGQLRGLRQTVAVRLLRALVHFRRSPGPDFGKHVNRLVLLFLEWPLACFASRFDYRKRRSNMCAQRGRDDDGLSPPDDAGSAVAYSRPGGPP